MGEDVLRGECTIATMLRAAAEGKVEDRIVEDSEETRSWLLRKGSHIDEEVCRGDGK